MIFLSPTANPDLRPGVLERLDKEWNAIILFMDLFIILQASNTPVGALPVYISE